MRKVEKKIAFIYENSILKERKDNQEKFTAIKLNV